MFIWFHCYNQPPDGNLNLAHNENNVWVKEDIWEAIGAFVESVSI